MTDTAEVAGPPVRTGEEVLLATALAAATLTEDVNRLVQGLYDFADWQVLNVTDEEALDLGAALVALHRGFVRHCAQARTLVADIDDVAARLGQDWAEPTSASSSACGGWAPRATRHGDAWRRGGAMPARASKSATTPRGWASWSRTAPAMAEASGVATMVGHQAAPGAIGRCFDPPAGPR